MIQIGIFIITGSEQSYRKVIIVSFSYGYCVPSVIGVQAQGYSGSGVAVGLENEIAFAGIMKILPHILTNTINTSRAEEPFKLGIETAELAFKQMAGIISDVFDQILHILTSREIPKQGLFIDFINIASYAFRGGLGINFVSDMYPNLLVRLVPSDCHLSGMEFSIYILSAGYGLSYVLTRPIT